MPRTIFSRMISSRISQGVFGFFTLVLFRTFKSDRLQRYIGIESKQAQLKINLRRDQRIKQIGSSNNDETVKIFAPEWTKMAVDFFRKHIPPNTLVEVCDRKGSIGIRLGNELTLKDLVMICRNEPANVSGRINFQLYKPLIEDRAVIYALKDLIRQTIIVGTDVTTHYGGYGSGRSVPQEKDVIIIDLIGLQFQVWYNSGRLVLIDDNQEMGALDKLIFESVVGEPKKTREQVEQDESGRYENWNGIYFDTIAYEMFVANDFLLVSHAVNATATTQVNLKFLKYGTGFFAGPYGYILEKHIIRGIHRGMKVLFKSGTNTKIKSFEFPFYKQDQNIIKLCEQNEVECVFSNDDCLKQTHLNLMTATTNCGDPHSVVGNEMGYSSVDAAIAQNLKSLGNKFSPILNQNMSEEFIKLPDIQLESDEKLSKNKPNPPESCVSLESGDQAQPSESQSCPAQSEDKQGESKNEDQGNEANKITINPEEQGEINSKNKL